MPAITGNGRYVLVIDSDARHLAWLTRIVRTLATTTSVRALDRVTEVSDFDLVVASCDGMNEPERTRLFETMHAANRDTPRLLVISSVTDSYETLFAQLGRYGLTHLVAQNREASATELIVTIQKILRNDIFGIEKYFGWGVETTSTRIRLSDEKGAVVQSAVNFAADLDVHPRLVEKFATAADELITNAFYNAPVDAYGRPRFAHLPRSTPVELPPHEAVVVTTCCDGQTLGVSIVDSFGAMTREQSLHSLVNCLRNEGERPDRNKGGAGIGLYMTFDSLNQLVLNLAPGRKTEVIGLIDVRGNYRDFASRGKSFNIFLDTGSAR